MYCTCIFLQVLSPGHSAIKLSFALTKTINCYRLNLNTCKMTFKEYKKLPFPAREAYILSVLTELFVMNYFFTS